MNTIKIVQDEPNQLDRLAAQRQLYADAKRILAIQVIFSVGVSVALTFWALNDPDHPQVRFWATLWGVGFTLTDLFFLTPMLKSRRKTAATIQEMFDCDVLQLPWKRGRSKVDYEEIEPTARRHERRIGQARFKKAFDEWYGGDLDTIPLEMARLVCQRSNFSWDVGLRQAYTGTVTGLLIFIVAVMFVYGAVRNPQWQSWISIAVVPLQPLIVLCLRQLQENHEAIAALGRLKKDTEKTWEEALASARNGSSDTQSLTTKARDIQDELWEQRNKNPLIFDWIYEALKKRSAQKTRVGNNALVQEARQALEKGRSQNAI